MFDPSEIALVWGWSRPICLVDPHVSWTTYSGNQFKNTISAILVVLEIKHLTFNLYTHTV